MYRIDPRRQMRLQIVFASALAGLGALILAYLLYNRALPRPLWLWGLFTVAYVWFEYNAVEVNDKLFASSSLMVLTTSAVIFSPESAVVGIALASALGPFTPADFKQRRWFQPLANFGQLVISAAVAGTVLIALLPPRPVTAADFWKIALASGVAAVVYGTINIGMVTVVVRTVFGQREVRPWSNMAALFLPVLGMGFLGGLLGATYHMVGTASLPLIFLVFFVGHMTFASYSQLREAQESTLRGFVKALEAKDLYTRGHTERVAYFSELIGRELGFSGTRLERLRWAALIHDVGKLAVPRELIRKKARLSREEYTQMKEHANLVEELLSEVDFLQPMVSIASDHHAHYDGNGYSPMEHDSLPPLEARILAVADSFDAMTSTRSYRVALSQRYAFGELRRHSGTQFDPDVVESFIDVLTRRGEEYGSPQVDSEAEARRRAEQPSGWVSFDG